MERPDTDLGPYYEELAGRFQAMGRFFEELGSPDATQQLVESLISGDAESFARFIDPIEIPDLPSLDKCFWVREIVENFVCRPAGLVEECWLRDDLTSDERRLYFQIALRYLKQGGAVLTVAEPSLRATRTVIPKGPFLDELKANGLVNCETRMTYECVLEPILGPPERICV